MLNDGLPVATLYRPELLEVIRSLGVDVHKLASEVSSIPGARVIEYPDGTLQLEGTGTAQTFESRGAGCFRDYAGRLAMAENPANPRYPFCGSGFNNLPAFPAMHYTVLHWGEFIKRWQGAVHVQSGRVHRFYQIQPSPLDNLMVTIAFRRRFKKAVPAAFVAHIAEWLNGVAAEGLFGEGKVLRVSSFVTFFDRVARFHLDASQSGQQTINWLILHLMNFCDVHPLEDIYFTTHPSPDISFDEEYALSRQESIEIPLAIADKPALKKGELRPAVTRLKVVRYEPDEDNQNC